MKKRVVVTGVGMITPVGLNTEESWEALKSGKCGIGKITRFDTSDYATQIAAEIKGFNPETYIEPKEVKKMAMDDSGLKITPDIAEQVGVMVGAGMGGLPAIETYHKVILEKGPKRMTPFFIPMVIINLASGTISIRFGAKGPNSAAVTACATGTHCIGDAARLIQLGEAVAMIAGGTEATVCPLGISGFNAMKALSTRNDAPEKASRPFDKDRDGFVMGEGSGILVLEEMEFAKARGARIYAEVVGYGMSGDAYHITAPSEDGGGAARCMKMAMRSQNILPEEVDYINAHATSTMADAIETRAIKTVFGEHAHKLSISGTKSMTGHLLGAAGGVEAVISVLSMRDGIIPPTINLDNPDPDCDLDYTPNVAKKKDVRIAMSNSFGFGGTNGTLIFRKLE